MGCRRWWLLSLTRPARRLTWVGGRSRPAPAGILARSPIPTTHSPLKGRSGGRDRFKGSRNRGGTRAEGRSVLVGSLCRNRRTEEVQMGEAAQLKRVIVTGPVAGVRVAVTGVIEMSG